MLNSDNYPDTGGPIRIPKNEKDFFSLVIVLATGCSGPQMKHVETLTQAPTIFTIANLHPDQRNSRLYTVNYQRPTLIPLCSEIEISEFEEKVVTFTIKGKNQPYSYFYHKAVGEPLDRHLQNFFGSSCPDISAFNQVDRDGIKAGKPAIGMSKAAVKIAMGPPPIHVNPSDQNDSWTYWISKFNKVIIKFDADAKVSQIIN